MQSDKPVILIIDDLTLSIQPLNAILGDAYHILSSSTGKEGLELAQTKHPDLILLGITLPDLEGLEICLRLKVHPDTRSIPILFISDIKQDIDGSQGVNMGVMDYITRPFSPAIVQVRVSNYLKLASYQQTENNLSTIDNLTGIPNRRQFDYYARREWGRAIRSRSPITIIMANIDCFKAYNENYGYKEGDECLRQLALLLLKTARRPTDLVARYSGEEFICLFPETDNPGGMRLAKQMWEKTIELNIPNAYSPVADHVTLCFGVATAIPELGQLPIGLIHKAENYMRMAKHNGRNQVLG